MSATAMFLGPLVVIALLGLVPLLIPLGLLGIAATLVYAKAPVVGVFKRLRLRDHVQNLSYGAAYYRFLLVLHVLGLKDRFLRFLRAKFPELAYLYRVYKYKNILLGMLSNLQEIREIVRRVERGEWDADLGDPMDHIKSEAKRGIVASGFLLYDPD